MYPYLFSLLNVNLPNVKIQHSAELSSHPADEVTTMLSHASQERKIQRSPQHAAETVAIIFKGSPAITAL